MNLHPGKGPKNHIVRWPHHTDTVSSQKRWDELLEIMQ